MDFNALLPTPYIPDHLTLPQFLFDASHTLRPRRDQGTPWLIEDDTARRISEQELRTRTNGLANALHVKHNIGEDDVVLMFSRNHVDYLITIWATLRLGGVISGANPDFTSNELLYQLQATKAAMLIVHPDVLPIALDAARAYGLSPRKIVLMGGVEGTPSLAAETRCANLKHDSITSLVEFGLNTQIQFTDRVLKPGEARSKLAFLNFSSGTTGRAKAVAMSHYAVIANVLQIAAHCQFNNSCISEEDRRYRPGDIALAVVPMYHAYGAVINSHFALFAAMSVVIVPKYKFVGMLESIVRHRVNHLFLVPPHIVLLCKHPSVRDYNLAASLRTIMSGAAPLSHELCDQLVQLFPEVHFGNSYGMTELTSAITLWPLKPKRGKSGSGGTLMPGVVARIIKPDGTRAGYDEPGELYISSPSRAMGYANNEQATRETFIDGWVRTGDKVKIDTDGELIVLDRLKEFIKVKAFQVAPSELEGCLLDHPDVSNACVVGVPDEYSGEVPLAFVVLTTGAAERASKCAAATDEIKKSITKHVAVNKVNYKHLAGGVEIIDAIPTSPSGKLLRRILREKARDLSKPRVKL